MKFLLRPHTTADLDAVASWITDSDGCRLWAGRLVPFPFEPHDLPSLLSIGEGRTFALSTAQSDELLGFGQWFDKGGGLVRLARIIVSPSFRGRGLARVLCPLIMQNAVESMPVETFALGVYRSNPAAIATYTSLGFSVVEEKSTADSLTMQLPANRVRAGF
jgi:ribosomal protein S18 acetylase RimI-like enzyme